MLKRTVVDKEEFARLARQGASVHRLSARFGLSRGGVTRLASELGVKPVGIKQLREKSRSLARAEDEARLAD